LSIDGILLIVSARKLSMSKVKWSVSMRIEVRSIKRNRVILQPVLLKGSEEYPLDEQELHSGDTLTLQDIVKFE